MEEWFLYFLNQLQRSTNLAFLLYDEQKFLIKSCQPPLYPNFPEKYVNDLKKYSAQSNNILLVKTGHHGLFTVLQLKSQTLYYLIIRQTANKLYHLKNSEVRAPQVEAAMKTCYAAYYHQEPPKSWQFSYLNVNQTIPKINQYDQEIEGKSLIHNNYLAEIKVFEAIQNGNLAEFQVRAQRLLQSGQPGMLAKGNDVRNIKDLTIAAITLLTRAVIKGGMLPERAYRLSDFCIQNLERLTSTEEVLQYAQKLPQLFITKLHTRSKYSDIPVIYAIQNHVYKHLTDKISLADIADTVGYSQNYLTRLFKEKTGLTIMAYIRQQKITEVKDQLLYTSLPIAKIASDFGFTDQSHLTKVFNKFEKMTPQQYRKQTRLPT